MCCPTPERSQYPMPVAFPVLTAAAAERRPSLVHRWSVVAVVRRPNPERRWWQAAVVVSAEQRRPNRERR